jgi:hypothetical protein
MPVFVFQNISGRQLTEHTKKKQQDQQHKKNSLVHICCCERPKGNIQHPIKKMHIVYLLLAATFICFLLSCILSWGETKKLKQVETFKVYSRNGSVLAAACLPILLVLLITSAILLPKLKVQILWLLFVALLLSIIVMSGVVLDKDFSTKGAGLSLAQAGIVLLTVTMIAAFVVIKP